MKLNLVILVCLMFCRVHAEYLPDNETKLTAIVDFEVGRIWFKQEADGELFLGLSECDLPLDDMLTSKSVLSSPVKTGVGVKWLRRVSRWKPKVQDGVIVKDFQKVKELISKRGYIEMHNVLVFKVSKEKVFTGPYYLENPVRITARKSGDLDESRFLLIPVK